MSADKLVHILGKEEIANLRSSLYGIQHLQLPCIPELNCSVLGASSTGQKTLFVRRPRDSLDSSLMLAEFC